MVALCNFMVRYLSFPGAHSLEKQVVGVCWAIFLLDLCIYCSFICLVFWFCFHRLQKELSLLTLKAKTVTTSRPMKKYVLIEYNLCNCMIQVIVRQLFL